MELKLVKYLRNADNALGVLQEKYFISAKRHGLYDNLILFKYNQINSPMQERFVRQCRGIILDESDNWSVVNYSFERFFNYGEACADKADLKSARVYEKLDGSLCQLFYYDNSWHVATSGSPDASGQVGLFDIDFRTLFWTTWKELGYELPKDNNMCYAFELCTPYNKVVVRHKKNRIVLHGARRLSDLQEQDPVVVAKENGWECVKYFSMNSWEEILNASSGLNPFDDEGYVVCDNKFRRVKIKSPKYVTIAHLRDGLSTRRLLELIIAGEDEEFLSYYEEYTGVVQQVKNKYYKLINEIDEYYNKYKHIDDRKEFALVVKDKYFSGILFGRKYGKTKSIEEGLARTHIKYLEEWLDLKSINLLVI